ncbi:hypothetical protein GYMLUDRAFT_164367, partial [Collybiopsis luxurians FD-317 M1]
MLNFSFPPPPGIYAPAVLFFHHESEDIDWESYAKHILWLAESGVTGVLIEVLNGEALHLSRSERSKPISFARETLDSAGYQSVMVIAETEAQSASETKELCAEAHEAGAGWVSVSTPNTWNTALTVNEIVAFHSDVASSSPIPYMIHNLPTVTTGIDSDSDIVSELAVHPDIVGTRLSCGSFCEIQRLSAEFDYQSTFATFAGQSDILLHTLLAGGAGVIGALVNVLPRVHVKIYQLFLEYQQDPSRNGSKLADAFVLQRQVAAAEWVVWKIGGLAVVRAIVARQFGYGYGMMRGQSLSVSLDKLVQSDVDTKEGKWWKTVQDMIDIENSL